MLSNDLIRAKTIDDLLEDARMQIPLYSKEWTNFNPSDPAVTVLEGISFMTVMQQNFIDMMPLSVQEKMLELTGCARQYSKSARVLLEPQNISGGPVIPSGQKFIVGSMVFETNRENRISGNKITGIYASDGKRINDYTYILDPDIPIKAQVFGAKPAAGMELYIICDGLGEPGEDLIFYFGMDERVKRNAIEDSQPFSDIVWQCYTEKGFTDMKVRDYTDGLLRSGEIRIKLPKQPAAVYSELPKNGCCIRAVLKKAEYDIPPSLSQLSGFLFEVWQKDTHSICYTFPGKNTISVYSDILENGYWMLFAKEEDGYYHKYSNLADEGMTGRYYRVERLGFGSFEITFDKERYGYAPGDFINAVKLVAYNEEIMSGYRLGTVFGYENQRMELPVKNILQDSFSIIAERELEDVGKVYDFIRPESENEYDLVYRLDETNNTIKITDAGDFIGAVLYMSGCATTDGELGNIRKGAAFALKDYSDGLSFINPAPGCGGRLTESLADVKKRFIRDVNEHYTAVEASDYERIVSRTPGLCIHKVKAVMDRSKNEVSIAVMPYAVDNRPVLSHLYREQIMKNIEKRRLLSTRVVLTDPIYVEVLCSGTVYVKPHYEGSREQIEAVIRKRLDYVNSEHNFGEVMSFDELFHSIEALECVELIYDLSCTSTNGQLAPKRGLDIHPGNNCLLIPGDIRIELISLPN